MKKSFITLLLVGLAANVFATSTTYEFKSKTWQSQVGSVVCDGTTDGWIGEAEGYSCSDGTVYPGDKLLHNAGVQVVQASAGKKVTSVLEFTNVRKVIVNYCIASSAKSDITITIGDTVMSQHVEKSMKINQDASINEDVEFVLLRERTGHVVLSIENMTKSTYIHSITVKADNGSGEVFSTKVYHLVTNINQLKDNDLIMIGVADGTTKKAMGYYDVNVSQNNIHSIDAKYDATREYINSNEEVTYLLNTAVSEKGKAACYTIIDPYEEMYLVASGGQTKNKLTLWTSPYSSGFGDYGYWDIQIAADGKATIKSLGTSKGVYMQYNATDKLFGCYPAENMTPVNIYRQEEAKDLTQPIIQAPMVNFGTVVKQVANVSGSKTIEVKTNKLTEDIAASLKDGSVFSLNASTIDRDGDKLTVSYLATTTGRFADTLVLTSGSLTEEVPVLLDVAKEMTIAEAVQSEDWQYLYLNPVTVTKKNDRYVYVRDETGSMLLYDKGADTDRYAKDLETGHVIKDVSGKFQNYYGVPELHMMAKPTREAQKVECLPEKMTEVADSADVCRYVVFEGVNVINNGGYEVVVGDKTLPITEKWVLPKESNSLAYALSNKSNIAGIVSYDHDAVVLYPMMVSSCEGTGIEEIQNSEIQDFKIQLLPDGRLVIVGNGRMFDLRGVRIDDVLY